MTYVSAPQIINAGNKVTFEDLEWSGVYQLKGSGVWDVVGQIYSFHKIEIVYFKSDTD
jgi:hypothetical protein